MRAVKLQIIKLKLLNVWFNVRFFTIHPYILLTCAYVGMVC